MLVLVWAVRLTGNWVYAFPGLHHEDWRYPMFRERAGRWEFAADLVAIHLIPTLQVFLGMVPVYVAVTTPGPGLRWLAVVAFVVGMAAVALEFVADAQMHRFVRDRRPGEVMDRGLWSWSRHPNYFGEFGFWFALALFGLAAAPGCLVAVRGGRGHAGDVPRRQHPDDGGPQPAAPPRLSGRHRPGAAVRAPAAGQGAGVKRVVIAGLGDTGVLTAIKLSRRGDIEVTGISAKPGLVSGQELGWRLARPDDWARHNWIPFGRFRGLDRVRTVHGTLAGVDLDNRTVTVELAAGGDVRGALRHPDHRDRGHQRFLAPADAAGRGRGGHRAAGDPRQAGRGAVGDRRRRRRGRGQQRRAARHEVAGHPGRPLFPRGARARRPPPADLEKRCSAG